MFGIDMDAATRLAVEGTRIALTLKGVDEKLAGSFFLTAMQAYCETNDLDMTEFVRTLADVTEETQPLRNAGLL